MTDVLRYEQTGGIAVVTLNRPDSLNALNPELLEKLAETLANAAEDSSVRCVVLTGEGRAFTAGGDLRGMVQRDGESGGGGGLGGAEVLRRQEESSRLLYEMPKPTIAAVNGAAAGAGMSLALAADLRIASEQARFGTAFARVGFSGDFGGTWLLQRLVGPAKAKELYFLPDVFGAQEALDLGIVTKVVPHEQLMSETMALAERLANGPTLAYGRIKDNFTFGATNTFADTLTREAENMIESGRTQDHRNAARAFLEKREPTFEGR